MANLGHVARLLSGIVEWNAWWRANPAVEADFSGADLIDADLRGADLSEADLTYADLRQAEGLTPAQLASACADPEHPAKLPEGWEQPPPCEAPGQEPDAEPEG